MSERLRASLEAVAEANIDGRFVLVGSIARAALMGDTHFSPFVGSFERNIDVIDKTGQLTDGYAFYDSAPIDFLLTRQLRPIQPDKWAMFDRVTTNDQPTLELPTGLIKLQMVDLQCADTSMPTFDRCTHLALRNINRVVSGYNFKHAQQYATLKRQKQHVCGDCTCKDWRIVMAQYHERLRAQEQLTVDERVYRGARWIVRSVAPYTFKRIQRTGLGAKIRALRSTDLNCHEATGASINDEFAHLIH